MLFLILHLLTSVGESSVQEDLGSLLSCYCITLGKLENCKITLQHKEGICRAIRSRKPNHGEQWSGQQCSVREEGYSGLVLGELVSSSLNSLHFPVFRCHTVGIIKRTAHTDDPFICPFIQWILEDFPGVALNKEIKDITSLSWRQCLCLWSACFRPFYCLLLTWILITWLFLDCFSLMVQQGLDIVSLECSHCCDPDLFLWGMSIYLSIYLSWKKYSSQLDHAWTTSATFTHVPLLFLNARSLWVCFSHTSQN